MKIRFKFHSFAEPYFAMMYEYAFGFPNRQFFYQCFKPEDDIKIKNKQIKNKIMETSQNHLFIFFIKK